VRGKPIIFASLIISVVAAIVPSAVRADGGTVRYSERRGDRSVTVFTSPTPLRAGLVDVSVLVLDANSGTPQVGVPVLVEAASADSQRQITRTATNEAATNKMMRAAEIDLAAGKWHIAVFVDDPAKRAPISFDVDVAEPMAPWLDTGLWIAWPFAAIGLFAVHRILVHRRRDARPPIQRKDRDPQISQMTQI
jgi:5-hydroxyisourate hydrolase-like protein (transthyretin family)